MVTMTIKTYSEMARNHSFEERFRYLMLRGSVGRATFGFDRWINQQFYASKQWKSVRNHVIARDEGLDLGCEGYEIYDRPIIHHMNPMTAEDIEDGNVDILEPEFLITTTHRTHNAIHFGDEKLLVKPLVARREGDTRLW